MSGWRWRTNLPYRLADPPAPHVPTTPPGDSDRLDGHDFAADASGQAPRNRSKRFPEQAGQQR